MRPALPEMTSARVLRRLAPRRTAVAVRFACSALTLVGGVIARRWPTNDAAGPGTRSGERHLARLRLIRRMQRDHLPLAEIRARLLGLTDDQILAAAETPIPEPVHPPAALDFVHELMAQSGVTPSLR